MDGANVANGLPAMKTLLKSDPKALDKVRVAMEKKIAEGTERVEV